MYPAWLEGGCHLFPGESQYNHFTIIFEMLKENKDEFISMNVNFSDLGSHSARKGAAIFGLCGCIVAPPITSICLCIGWLIGNVKSCYL